MDALFGRRRILWGTAAVVVAVAAGACLMVALDRLWLDALSLLFRRGASIREAGLSILMFVLGAGMIPVATWLSAKAEPPR